MCQLMPKHTQKYGNYGKSVHVNINFDNNIHYVFEDVLLPGDFKNSDTSINVVSLEQYDEDYIRQGACICAVVG